MLPALDRYTLLMWLITTIGFFSVVRKPGDSDLTVRARVREDLEALNRDYLPGLGPITSGEGTDYRYRARCEPSELAEAVARLVREIDYANFKDAVASRQSPARARVYGEVWSSLWALSRLEGRDG